MLQVKISSLHGINEWMQIATVISKEDTPCIVLLCTTASLFHIRIGSL